MPPTLTRERKPPKSEAQAQRRLTEIEGEIRGLGQHRQDLLVEQAEMIAIVLAAREMRRGALVAAEEKEKAAERRRRLDDQMRTDPGFARQRIKQARANVERMEEIWATDRPELVDEARAELARLERLAPAMA